MTFPNSSRHYLDRFAADAGAACPENALMLDAGAGKCPYKHHFAHARYESADICQIEREYGQITYVCDLRQIPVEDARFDFVFFSQTLEHVPDPSDVLAELFRVMKPGASIWLSAPLFYEEHEQPWDFYRYTQFGFKHLLEKAGFEMTDIQWLEGYFGTLSYQCKCAAAYLPKRRSDYGTGVKSVVRWIWGLGMKAVFAANAFIFSHMDRAVKFTGKGMCKNYRVVARKPA